MPPKRILIVGDFDHFDFLPAVHWLRKRASVACATNLESALSTISVSPAEFCLFAQARPGRISQDAVEQLHRVLPLARMATLLGAWCEGELRTATPLTGVTRIYWHEWRVKLGSLWDAANASHGAGWALPRTVVGGERTLAAAKLTRDDAKALIAIRAVHAVSYAALAAACRAAGWMAAWLDPAQPARMRNATALLWEGDVRDVGQRDELAQLASILDPAPTLVLAHFPRREDTRLAFAAGAVDLISQPVYAADLMRRLRAAAPSLGAGNEHSR